MCSWSAADPPARSSEPSGPLLPEEVEPIHRLLQSCLLLEPARKPEQAKRLHSGQRRRVPRLSRRPTAGERVWRTTLIFAFASDNSSCPGDDSFGFADAG